MTGTEELLRRLTEFPCGAAVKTDQQLDAALAGRPGVIFILRGNGLELAPTLRVRLAHGGGEVGRPRHVNPERRAAPRAHAELVEVFGEVPARSFELLDGGARLAAGVGGGAGLDMGVYPLWDCRLQISGFRLQEEEGLVPSSRVLRSPTSANRDLFVSRVRLHDGRRVEGRQLYSQTW